MGGAEGSELMREGLYIVSVQGQVNIQEILDAHHG